MEQYPYSLTLQQMVALDDETLLKNYIHAYEHYKGEDIHFILHNLHNEIVARMAERESWLQRWRERSVITLPSLIIQRRRQYLVHCYLYYELDETVISDSVYWTFCDELIQLQAKHPDLCASLPFHDLCADLDNSYTRPNGSYPESIRQTAFQLIAYRDKLTLEQVASRYGLAIVKEGKKK